MAKVVAPSIHILPRRVGFLLNATGNSLCQCKCAVNNSKNSARCIATTTPFPEFEGLHGLKTHEDLYKFSLERPELFWSKLARSRLTWYKDFDQVKDCDMQNGSFKWFINGRLNASVNCVDRHLENKANQAALLWEKDEPGQQEYVTYRQLSRMVNKIGNVLRAHGVKRGDRVAIYLPTSPMVIASMLACSRVGAIHNVVFAGFSAEALAGRINDGKAETVITSDQAIRGGKIIELKKTVDSAVEKSQHVKRVFVFKRTGNDVPMRKIDIPMEEEMENHSEFCKPEEMDSEEMLFMLYTSGSTGKPKGLAHSHAGYLLYAGLTQKHVFDYRDGELFSCVADIGWITGHSYVMYGPLLNGATTLLFESTPTYPNPGRYWEMVERLKINHMYVAPTSLRLLLKSGDHWATKYDRSSLRKLGCVGEPLNHEAWEWFNNVVGENRCDLCDTWWQTETGGISLTPRPSAPSAEIKSGMPMRPFFGIDPVIMDENGKELTGRDVHGSLCIRYPWPGMARTIYDDHKRFMDTYYRPFPGIYFSGDGAHRHSDGYYQITGRMDDVLNVSGHRLGTAEIEDIMDDHPDVAETAVVGYPHSIKGEGIYAYVVLKDDVEGTDEMVEDLKLRVKNHIASYAQPDLIQFTPSLPRTRSGKIMRRILRKVADNKADELGDVSTLQDPSVVEVIVKNHEQFMKTHHL